MTAYCHEHQQREPCPLCQVLGPGPAANVSRAPALIDDREMWIIIRAALLGILKALDMFSDRRAPLVVAIRAAMLSVVRAIEQRWGVKRPTKMV